MMTKNWLKFSALAILLAGFGILGCSDDNDSGPPPSEVSMEDREDVADDFGAALADDDEGMLQYWRDDVGGGPDAREPGSGRDGALDDTLIVEHNGFTAVRIRNFFDLFDVWYPYFDPLITVRMDQYLSVHGSHTSPNGHRTVSVDHDDTLYVTGLGMESDRKTLNGNGERVVEGEFQSRFRQNVKSCSSAYAWQVNSVVFARDMEENRYPLSGDIDVHAVWRSTHENPGGSRQVYVNVMFTVIFNGSRYAEVVMEDGTRFWIDLEGGHPHRTRPGGD